MARIGRDLVAQARMLAKSEPRRPKQATLRRAVSTAYYGLFHFLIEESAAWLFGTGHGDAAFRHLAARAFIHTKMKSVCTEFVKPNPSQVNPLLRAFWQRFGIANSQSARLVAQSFIDLQDDRHAADYDMAVSFSRQDALNAVTQAEQAFSAWRQLKARSPETCRLFGTAMILWPGLAGR
jgi:uncharacterized protein (UPF0332 family)